MMTIQPVPTADFQYASQLMEKAFATSGNQFERAKAAISKFCCGKFKDDQVSEADELSEALTLRLLCWAKFMREHWPLLVSRGLMLGQRINKVLEDVAAYLPLEDELCFDPEKLLAEVDRHLGKDHVPVTEEELERIEEALQETEAVLTNHPKEPLPEEIKHFVQMFAHLRTVKTHIDPETNVGECTDEQLVSEINAWIKKNPVFTKDDLDCMKIFLRRLGVPKQTQHALLQDMREKTFYDLCLMIGRWDDVRDAAVRLQELGTDEGF
jgi:hypothetical protein